MPVVSLYAPLATTSADNQPNFSFSLTLNYLPAPVTFRAQYPRANVKSEQKWLGKCNHTGTIVLESSNNNRHYFQLFYEGIFPVPLNFLLSSNNNSSAQQPPILLIKGEHVQALLEHVCHNLVHLNTKEANDFITYWLPQLENNALNAIQFLTETHLQQQQHMKIEPTPDYFNRIQLLCKPIYTQDEISVLIKKHQQEHASDIIAAIVTLNSVQDIEQCDLLKQIYTKKVRQPCEFTVTEWGGAFLAQQRANTLS